MTFYYIFRAKPMLSKEGEQVKGNVLKNWHTRLAGFYFTQRNWCTY
jgi:hypothetical protein